MENTSPNPVHAEHTPHRGWVRATHWIATLSFLVLAFTGVVILMCHPRLYWGEVGNDLTPALFELPISRNYQHGGFETSVAFFQTANSPVSASRTYDIFNQNGWGRSLHFLAAWFLVAAGIVYLLAGLFTRHFMRHLLPTRNELTAQLFWQDLVDHFRLQIPTATGGPQYSVLQKSSYVIVIFFALPLAVITGLTMSPAITAAFPFLLTLFGGVQSARTIHFFSSLALELFLIVHLVMIVLSGFKRQLRAMTLGN